MASSAVNTESSVYALWLLACLGVFLVLLIVEADVSLIILPAPGLLKTQVN